MTDDDYEDTPQLGEILSGILAGLALSLDGGEFMVGDNVIDLAEHRRMRFHVGAVENGIVPESQAGLGVERVHDTIPDTAKLFTLNSTGQRWGFMMAQPL